jgi:hypothetical protein
MPKLLYDSCTTSAGIGLLEKSRLGVKKIKERIVISSGSQSGGKIV